MFIEQKKTIMNPKQQILHHPSKSTKEQINDYSRQQPLSLLNTTEGVKKVKRSRKKDCGFCFTVNKASTPPSPLFCRLTGIISDWVQDQKQELFLPLLRRTKALTLLSPLLSFSSPLSLLSLSAFSLSQVPIEYTQEYLMPSLFSFISLCIFV